MANPGLSGDDKEQGNLRDEAALLPEGLQRPRLGLTIKTPPNSIATKRSSANRDGSKLSGNRGQIAKNNAGLQDDHDPSDIGQRTANKPKQRQSQMEGPAAYAPHDEGEKEGHQAARQMNLSG